MKNWFNKNYRTIIVSTFLIPIITVAAVSISHVTKWYGISNPFIWAIYLSIGIEIAALSSLAAISANMGKKVYLPFGIVTLIQFIGNIYYTYFFIDVDSESFVSWVELVSPLIEFIGVESTDLVGHRRFLSFFSGGMLPLISLSFLHMLVKFTEEDRIKYGKTLEESKDQNEINIINSNELIGEISKARLSENDLKYIESILSKKKYLKKNQPKKNQPKKVQSKKVIPKQTNIESVPTIISDEIPNSVETSISDIITDELNIKDEVIENSFEDVTEPIIENQLHDDENIENNSEELIEQEIINVEDIEPVSLEEERQYDDIDENIAQNQLETDEDLNETIESEEKKK